MHWMNSVSKDTVVEEWFLHMSILSKNCWITIRRAEMLQKKGRRNLHQDTIQKCLEFYSLGSRIRNSFYCLGVGDCCDIMTIWLRTKWIGRMTIKNLNLSACFNKSSSYQSWSGKAIGKREVVQGYKILFMLFCLFHWSIISWKLKLVLVIWCSLLIL
jgi:hypothetical protein